MENKYKNYKTSELLDIYSSVSDEDSIEFMDEFWTRFPMDVWEDKEKFLNEAKKDFQDRIKTLEIKVELQDRIIKRIDALTLAVDKLAIAIRNKKK
ncbi:hypothetical protein GOV10_03675 [Candidatus Woesearchaeota archaeon]|nr:hypothetical protein [Candidatus Woesearchaeota archaeon]